MADGSDWIYCRLIDRGAFIFPRLPFWLGQVEFSDTIDDEELCAPALAESANAFSVSESPGKRKQLVRARLLMPGMEVEAARRFGAFHLLETLEAFNAHLSLGVSELRATDAGYVYDVRSRSVSPLLPPWKDHDFTGVSAMLDRMWHHPLHILNTLYCAPQAFGELGYAFRRSSHWRVLAERAEDEGEAMLLYWMAAECLCKQRPDEEIGSKLLAACGFPTGRVAQLIAPPRASQLRSLPCYRAWQKLLRSLFEALRVARNQIVHAGFRHVDLPTVLRDDQRALAAIVLPLATKSLAEMALQGLNLHQTTLSGMWQRYDAVLQPAGVVHHARWFLERLDSFHSP